MVGSLTMEKHNIKVIRSYAQISLGERVGGGIGNEWAERWGMSGRRDGERLGGGMGNDWAERWGTSGRRDGERLGGAIGNEWAEGWGTSGQERRRSSDLHCRRRF